MPEPEVKPDDKTGETKPDDKTGTTTTTDPDPQAEIDKWKAMARKHEANAKANADKASRFDEIEEANKSETEKLTSKAAEAEKKAATAELRALRLEVASEKGLTTAQAKRLVGATKEEIEADADELLETFGTPSDKDKGGPPARKPAERAKGGNEPEEDADIDIPDVVKQTPRL